MSFKDENNQSRLSVSGLVLKKFPEVWNYSVFASVLLCIPYIAFVKYVRVSVSSFRFLANKELVKAFFHTWKAPFFCVAALLFAILFLVEFTAKFSLAEAVLTNGKTGFFTNIKNAFRLVFRSFRYFFGRRKNRMDKTKPSKGEKVRRDFIPFIQTVVAVPIVIFIAYIFLLFVPELLIMYWENNLPFGYHTPSLTELFISGFGGFYFSETDLRAFIPCYLRSGSGVRKFPDSGDCRGRNLFYYSYTFVYIGKREKRAGNTWGEKKFRRSYGADGDDFSSGLYFRIIL